MPNLACDPEGSGILNERLGERKQHGPHKSGLRYV